MEPSTTASPSDRIPDLLGAVDASPAHRHAAERILAIGRRHAPGFRWERRSHTGSRPSRPLGFLHFAATAEGWDPDIVQLHLRWERPIARPSVPELSLDATAGGYEHQGQLLLHAPREALRRSLSFQSADDAHCRSLVAGELARMRQPLLHLRLKHAAGQWNLAPQHLLASWPLTLPRPADLRFAEDRDAYRLIAWLVHALDGFRLLAADP